MKRICHITTAHTRYDSRIFFKECSSLAEEFETHLIVADGKGDEVRNRVSIHDIGKHKNRITRFVRTAFVAYKKATSLQCDIYHFHDPDFLVAALFLQFRGNKVVYDIHEDVPRQTLTKEYLGLFRKPIAFFLETLENFCASRFSMLITATPFIEDRFLKINEKTITVSNYPLLSELQAADVESNLGKHIAYIGAITRIKGVAELVDAMEFVDTNLELAGVFESDEFRLELEKKTGWTKVKYHGHLDRMDIQQLLARCAVGVVAFHPVPNYINSLPIKMFEYMLGGLPIIASNFPLWKSIVETNNCGLLVDPNNPMDIAEKINLLIKDEDKSFKLGSNGQNAIIQNYNWGKEKVKLLRGYIELLN